MRGLKILGCANALSGKKITIKDQTRYRLAEGETLLDLCEQAVKEALKDAQLDIADIDCIIGGMATPLQLIPCNAALIHERVAKGLEIPAMDINTTCTSFVSALDMASYLIAAGRYQRILIVSGDCASAALNPNQQESFELFSDAVSAFVVGQSKEAGVLYADQRTWSEGAHDTEIRGGGGLKTAFLLNEDNKEDYYFDMKGIKVLKLAAKKLPGFLKDTLQKAELTIEDIDLVVPHQASKALDIILSRLGLQNTNCINCVKEYGNMVSASIPFMLCRAIHEKQIVPGSVVMLMGTAAGLTTNILIMKY